MHGSTGRIFYVCSSAKIKCCFQVDNNTGDQQPDSAAVAWSQQLTELAASVTTLQSQHREADLEKTTNLAALQHSIMQQQAQHIMRTSAMSALQTAVSRWQLSQCVQLQPAVSRWQLDRPALLQSWAV